MGSLWAFPAFPGKIPSTFCAFDSGDVCFCSPASSKEIFRSYYWTRWCRIIHVLGFFSRAHCPRTICCNFGASVWFKVKGLKFSLTGSQPLCRGLWSLGGNSTRTWRMWSYPKLFVTCSTRNRVFFFQGNEFGVFPLGLIKVTSPESSSPKSLHWNVSSGMIVFIRLQFMSKIAGFV